MSNIYFTSMKKGDNILIKEKNDKSYNDHLKYYRDILMDKFLTNNFLSTSGTEIQDNIIDAEISITTQSSLSIAGTDTGNINRTVFLLSCSEAGRFDTSITGNEALLIYY
jgi:hypothetical protein